MLLCSRHTRFCAILPVATPRQATDTTMIRRVVLNDDAHLVDYCSLSNTSLALPTTPLPQVNPKDISIDADLDELSVVVSYVVEITHLDASGASVGSEKVRDQLCSRICHTYSERASIAPSCRCDVDGLVGSRDTVNRAG